MKKNDALKKHHFWILLGVVPLFTLIGALVVSSSVGRAVAERQKLLDDAKTKITPKLNPKPKSLIQEADKLVAVVSSKQGDLHKANWDRQKNLFTWPAGSPLLRDIELGEANIEKAADPIIERSLPANLPPAERAAKAKEVRDELAKLTPLDRTAKLKEMLDQLPIPPAERKAIMEPAWPKFGDPLPTDRGEFDEFKGVYRAQFSTLKDDGSGGPGTGMADRVAPTQFRGGWRSVLRHVNDFGQVQLTKDQVWLMMEDIWVQRSLLDAVRAINEERASFRRAKFDKDGNAAPDPSFDDAGNKLQLGANGQPARDPRTGRFATAPTPEPERRKGLFASRTWALELEVVREGAAQRLAGRLTNLTDRLQLLGVGNVMTLNVWFKNSAQPMPFRIGGEYVPGKGATRVVRGPDGKEQTVPANVIDIVATQEHVLPAGSDPNAELLRVEQVFDVRTVPVKRIDALQLGKTDSRLGDAFALLPPQSPPFAKEPEAAAPADTGTGTGSMTMPMPTGTSLSGPTFPGAMGGAAPAKVLAGGGPLAAVIDGNKKRYLIVSSEVRRMPVGVALVVDQSLIQDVLLAFANSPLRFQITQIGWTAFAGKLEGAAAPAAGSTGEGGVDFGGGTVNYGETGNPYSNPYSGSRKPGVSMGVGPTLPIPTPGMGLGPVPGMPGASPFGKQASTVSESQITSGLVELSIYGVVSLYEKYAPPKDEASAGAVTAPTPTPAPAPSNNAPPTEPTPAAPNKPAPKMRRRARR